MCFLNNLGRKTTIDWIQKPKASIAFLGLLLSQKRESSSLYSSLIPLRHCVNVCDLLQRTLHIGNCTFLFSTKSTFLLYHLHQYRQRRMIMPFWYPILRHCFNNTFGISKPIVSLLLGKLHLKCCAKSSVFPLSNRHHNTTLWLIHRPMIAASSFYCNEGKFFSILPYLNALLDLLSS